MSKDDDLEVWTKAISYMIATDKRIDNTGDLCERMADYIGITDMNERLLFRKEPWEDNYNRIIQYGYDPFELLAMLRMIYD